MHPETYVDGLASANKFRMHTILSEVPLKRLWKCMCVFWMISSWLPWFMTHGVRKRRGAQFSIMLSKFCVVSPVLEKFGGEWTDARKVYNLWMYTVNTCSTLRTMSTLCTLHTMWALFTLYVQCPYIQPIYCTPCIKCSESINCRLCMLTLWTLCTTCSWRLHQF